MASDLHAVNRARDIIAVGHVWDASESAITAAMIDLLHLAWVGTNDDGEGMLPEALIEDALTEFRATIHQRQERQSAEQLAEQRRIRYTRLSTALSNLQHEASGPLPSVDPLHPAGSPYLTHERVAMTLTRTADDLTTWLDLDEPGTLELNQLVSLFTSRIADPGCSIEEALKTSQDPTDTVVVNRSDRTA